MTTPATDSSWPMSPPPRSAPAGGATPDGFMTLRGCPAQVEAMASAWARGERVSADELLASHPGLGDEAAIRLIYEEVCLAERPAKTSRPPRL